MIYTSYYAKYKGKNGVSISKGANWFEGETYIPLVPDWSLIKAYKLGEITEKEYRKAYIKQLKQLDVHEVYKYLDGKVLLCFEKTGDFCHRHIVQEWFNRARYSCKELMGSEEPVGFHNCLFCKKGMRVIGQGHSVTCKVTGEVIELPKGQVCDDWRYTFWATNMLR